MSLRSKWEQAARPTREYLASLSSRGTSLITRMMGLWFPGNIGSFWDEGLKNVAEISPRAEEKEPGRKE